MSNLKVYETTLPIKMLNTDNGDNGYQHPLDIKRVKKIVNEYDPIMVENIKVSRRQDGTYWIMDGQHTCAALKEIFGDEHEAKCTIYEGMSFADEATFFERWNTKGKKPTYNEILKARFVAKNPDILNYVNCFYMAGVSFTWKKTSGDSEVFCAHKSGLSIYLKYGSDILVETLKIVKFSGDPSKYNGSVVRAVALLLYRFPQIDKKILREKVRAVNQFDLAREASCYSKLMTSSGGNSGQMYAIAKALLAFYNKGRTSKRIPWE